MTQIEVFLEREHSHAHINLRLTTTASLEFALHNVNHSVTTNLLLPNGTEVSPEAVVGTAISGLFFELGQQRQGGKFPCITVSIDHIHGQLDEVDLTIVAEIASIALACSIDTDCKDSRTFSDDWKLVDIQKLIVV